ncbi:tetratricopeptide repeat protein, partial [bacterium]|nr:tetratricopeptide repeat protein [bacterium]
AAALKALAIDPGLAEAHAALAYVEGDYYWNWPASEKSFKKALDLNPEYADGHHWYGEHLSAMGRYPEALAEYRRALELDPLSLIINTNIAHAYYFSRDYHRAIEQCRQAIALDANFPNAHADLGRAFLLKGMQREAITELETASRLDGGPINGHGRLGYAFAVSGRRTDALRLIDEMTRPSGQKMVPAVAIALVYVGLRNHDRAIHWLNVAAEQRSPRLALIKVDPLYDDLRPDPRFLNLLRRMNLAP